MGDQKNKYFEKSPTVNPKIYGFTLNLPDYAGKIKIGYTSKQSAEARINQQLSTLKTYDFKLVTILLSESAVKDDGTIFNDTYVHNVLRKKGFKQAGREWFEISLKDLKSVLLSIKAGKNFKLKVTESFEMRPEQKLAVKQTASYFKSFKAKENRTPEYLWNCKMRFGKTFTAYQLAKKMKWKKVLVLTFKPAVEDSWENDLLTHTDFPNWQFVSRNTQQYNEINKKKPFVWFASFQDFLGRNKNGGIKINNQEAHDIQWDCIILDEYHFGAWRDAAKDLTKNESDLEVKDLKNELSIKNMELFDENKNALKANHFLYLSGTPFRALKSGEFIEEQIFNWTYSDEQKAKEEFAGEENPYLSLPKMVMMTYKIPPSLTKITSNTDYDEFDLNIFFKASFNEGEKNFETVEFKKVDDVQKWINIICGKSLSDLYNNPELINKKPILPFYNAHLVHNLKHTLWFLPSVASCYAMKNLLQKNAFFKDYKIIVCAGIKAGTGKAALNKVKEKMGKTLETKSIILTCGKLTTGVTLPALSGLFMLRNTTSPETYFQAAFRVQSPWTIPSDNIGKKKIIKHECYIFDFAPNRALKLISDYSCRLNLDETDQEKKVGEFKKYLPVICFEGSTMWEVSASEILEFANAGTSGSQLARKFNSARLVNVDNATLTRIINNPEVIEILKKIEGFRNVKNDAELIINKSEKIKKAKTREEKFKPKEKKEISAEERERNSLRKEFQEKLQQFVTKIPIFMYLTDFREKSLKEVIEKEEPKLFEKTTGLTLNDFKILIKYQVFNSDLMNDAIFSFKRYEDSSLGYTGIVKKKSGGTIGGFDIVKKISNKPSEFIDK